MPRGVKKEHLPSKVCVVCQRPFTWRKKWEKCWDEVTTCSKSCNSQRRQKQQQEKKRLLAAQNNDHDNLNHHPMHHAGLESDRSVEEVPQQSPKKDKKKNTRRRQNDVSSVGDDGVEQDTAWKELMEVVDELTSISDDTSNKQKEPEENINDEHSTDSDDENDLLSALADAEHNEINNSADDDERNGDMEQPDFDSLDPAAQKKALRKAEKKRKKAERRAQRQGRGDPSAGQKPCDMCGKGVDLLIRCQYDETLQWKMVCGKCWKTASGGVVDGDAAHPYYKYGGLWKNRRRK